MPVKILITSWNAYSAVDPRAGRQVGGLETASWAMAKELAKHPEFRVFFGVRVDTLPAQVTVAGVELIPVVLPLSALRRSMDQQIQVIPRFPWLRILQWDFSLLWKIPVMTIGRQILGRVDWMQRTQEVVHRLQPDMIVAFGNSDDSRAALHAARQKRIPGLLWLQSNTDVNERIFSGQEEQDPYGVGTNQARDCLESATRILCQTQIQQAVLQQHLTIPTELVRTPVDPGHFFPLPPETPREFVLWIGRYDRFHKRPLLALEVARQHPEISFRFIINPGSAEVQEEFLRQCPPNVTVLDYLPHDQIPQTFRTARLFLSTGSQEFEGFPNVFLEAAASGTPVCSLEDFDGFLEQSQAGASTNGDIEQLADLVQTGWQDDVWWQTRSTNGPAYVREHHSPAATLSQVSRILNEMLPRPHGCE